ADIGQLSLLESLYLHSNLLTGAIPRGLGQLSGLVRLELHNNQLTGSIPAEMGGLRLLAYMMLNSNALTGYEPGAFLGMRAMRSIDLRDNQLSESAVDAIINDIYTDRTKHFYQGTKILWISGGTNAAPSAAACVLVEDLRANHDWAVNTNGC
ncbi:MAG: hypothetical protein JRH20_29580, partial [Deltaproteobacteria bacterium]|nr:hypothetical protein [Deltaproteobacteria bacterium]